MFRKMFVMFALIVSFLTTSNAEDTQTSFSDLQKRWTDIRKDLNLPGMAVTVVQGNKILWTGAFGIRDPEKNLPVTKDTIFYIASSTKSFLAMAMMILVEEGKIQLDAPVKTYLKRFAVADKKVSEQITVRDLLTHKSGLDNTPISFAEAFTGEIDDEKFYRLLPATSSTDKFGYNNVHYTLAGRIIEEVTGKTWKEFVKSRILEPAGMKRTFTEASLMYADRNVAQPLKEIAGVWQIHEVRKTDRTMHAAGGMGASISDLSRWLLLNINEGRIEGKTILPAKRIQEMQTQHVAVGQNFYEFSREGYGLGWYIGSYKSKKLIHHFGGFNGYRAHVSFMPEEKLGIAVVVNNAGDHSSDFIACEIYDRLLKLAPKDLLVDLKKDLEEDRAQREKNRQHTPNPAKADKGLSMKASKYAGEYFSKDWGRLQIEMKDGILTGSIGVLPFTLYSSSMDRFTTILPDGLTKGEFVIGADQKVDAVKLEVEDLKMEFTRF